MTALFFYGEGFVQKSLMPKGVDHVYARLPEPERLVVQKSLMPKGVDHTETA